MAIQDAKKFVDALGQDSQLKAKVKGSLDDVAQIAQQHGYDVSAHDLREELRTRWGTAPRPNYEVEPGCTFDSI